MNASQGVSAARSYFAAGILRTSNTIDKQLATRDGRCPAGQAEPWRQHRTAKLRAETCVSRGDLCRPPNFFTTSQAELEAEFDEQDLSVHAAHSSRPGDGLPWGRNLSPRVGFVKEKQCLATPLFFGSCSSGRGREGLGSSDAPLLPAYLSTQSPGGSVRLVLSSAAAHRR